MGTYMYPIQIKREPQKVRYTKEFNLNSDSLTLAELRKYVSQDETFSIYEAENSIYGSQYILNVSGERLETEEEVKTRVAKEEKYMESYTKFHANKPK